MNEQGRPQPSESVLAQVPLEKPKADSRLRRGFWRLVQWMVGGFLMQSPAGALVVAGWLQRYTRRAIHKNWWCRRPGRTGDRGGDFRSFAGFDPMFEGEHDWPKWILGQDFERAATESKRAGWWGRLLRGWLGSLAANLGAGIRVLGNVWVLTLPGAVLWLVGWWGGWQNSFHKGYEQALVGLVVSWLGILLFIASLFYVPMAMARQASTGRWKSFWDGRTVWTLIRASWLQGAGVALIFAAANGLTMGLKSWPQFLPQFHISELSRKGLDPTDAFRRGIEAVDWSNLSDAEALQILNRHYFWSALVVFGVLLVLRRVMGWLYATAVLKAVQRGSLGEEQLSEEEWRLLHTLGLLRVTETPTRPWLLRIVAWAGTKAGRCLCGVVMFLAWFGFVGAVYVTEFLSYHPVVGWLNQPLVQLPWFRYVPPHLENPVPGLAAAVLVTLAWALVTRRSRRGMTR